MNIRTRKVVEDALAAEVVKYDDLQQRINHLRNTLWRAERDLEESGHQKYYLEISLRESQ